uniref:MMS1_N domain-containing protein n=1 Tax=Globodera pallida TaxID=36090 RepID=A0A183CSS9_GLOPA
LNICVPRADGYEETCKDGLILCFVGQMDPENAPVITQFQLKNLKNNEIATKCKNAQPKWPEPEFEGKTLHGFQIVHVRDKLLLFSSTSLETVTCNVKDEPCCEVRLGEPGILGGFVAGQPLNESETFVDKAWRGGLLRQENPVSALAFDFLGYIPQGGGLGIIADKCDMQITLVDC